jgi:hypothetical protein
MDLSTSALANRATGAFPISIATSLAIESFATGTQAPYDPERKIPQFINISDYDSIWINLFTLYRNIVGALPSKGADAVVVGDIWHVLEFETDLLKRLIEEKSFGKTKVIFYASEYKGLALKHPNAKLKENKTEKQIVYAAIMEKTVNYFIQQQAKSDNIKVFERLIKPAKPTKSLIITHYAYDLLADKHFEKLDLLETHTGILKTNALFYTKLTDGKDLMRIPFGAWSLQVFGDSTLFSSLGSAIKKQIIDLSNQYQWNNRTTKDRLLMSFDSLPDKFTASILKKMLSE